MASLPGRGRRDGEADIASFSDKTEEAAPTGGKRPAYTYLRRRRGILVCTGTPTIREIGAAVRITAPSLVNYHVDALVLQGRLRQEPGVRGIFLAQPFGFPVKGAIAAGLPLDLFDDGEQELLEFGELISAPLGFPVGAPPLKEIYALRVRGQSMIEDGILNGDYVLIAPAQTVENGTIAVALHRAGNGDHGAATLKRVFVEDDGVLLQPANPAFTPRRVSSEEWSSEWEVQGRVVAVYRRYLV